MPTDLPPPPDPQGQIGPPISGAAGRPPDPPHDSGSIRIATVAGIPIRLHFTFLLLLAWIAIVGFESKTGQRWTGLLFVVGLFACVLLHELGHALVALRFYNVPTRSIILYPIGGVSSMETLPGPRKELWIALAGPCVNLVIAAILAIAVAALGLPHGALTIAGSARDLPGGLLWANLILAVFNLLPAFPMDGGRVLRALIARVTGSDVTATEVAARVGQLMAIAFGIYALYAGNFLLIIIAVFVYLGAGQESAVFQARTLIEGHRVREAMVTDFRTLGVGTSLREAANLVLAGSQHDFPIVHGEEVVGLLSRNDLFRGIATDGPDGYVASAMQREFARTTPDTPLDTLLTRPPGSNPILVFASDDPSPRNLVGMVTQENLLEFLTLARLSARIQQAPR